jgi:alpha-D-ribose 1-methylphosphonate 5-triphosphate synthase subunit PhnH
MSALAPAFAEPVLEAQSVFRAVMNATARPGRVQFLDCELAPPAPLSQGAAAVALALFDYETPVWLDRPLSDAADVVRWLRFHTGAPFTDDPGRAAFAVIADARKAPDFAGFAPGTPDYPDRSTTLILQADSLSSGQRLVLAGPGIDGEQELHAAPLPDDFAGRLVANRALFPRGVDLLLVTDYAVAAIPRSAHIAKER